jgi:hypothetical protein
MVTNSLRLLDLRKLRVGDRNASAGVIHDLKSYDCSRGIPAK